jgi:hypothetical protein
VFDAPAPLGYWHLASLDAPTVAVVWTLAFAWSARVSLPFWVPLLLALAAWTVYIGDRLLDARSALRAARPGRLRLRHRFHWRHRRIFLPVGLAAACAAAVLVFSCMPVAARERNSILAAAALVYFTRVHSTRDRTPSASLLRAPFLTPLISPLLSKEMLVGLLFTAACVLPALTRSAQPVLTSWTLVLPAAFFALLAWLNCHAIECWESRANPSEIPAPHAAKKLDFGPGVLNGHDFSRAINPLELARASSGQGCSSGSTLKSRSFSAARPALALGLTGLLAAAVLAGHHPRPAALVAAGVLSALLLALLDQQRNRLTPLALRAAADLVLLTPALLLIR